MSGELERGDDAEVAPTAAQTPEQVLVVVRRRSDDAPISSDDFGGDEVVGRQTRQPAEPAESAPQCEARHAGVTDEPSGHRQAVFLRRAVELLPRGAAATDGSAGVRVDGHRVHRGQIDHQAAVAERKARVVVPTATNRNLQPGLAGEGQGRHDIGARGTAHNDRGATVDGAVPDGNRLVVAGLTRQCDHAAHVGLQVCDRTGCLRHVNPPVYRGDVYRRRDARPVGLSMDWSSRVDEARSFAAWMRCTPSC